MREKPKSTTSFAPTDPPAPVHLHIQQPETPEKDITRLSAGRLAIMDLSFLFHLSFSPKKNQQSTIPQLPASRLADCDRLGGCVRLQAHTAMSRMSSIQFLLNPSPASLTLAGEFKYRNWLCYNIKMIICNSTLTQKINRKIKAMAMLAQKKTLFGVKWRTLTPVLAMNIRITISP